MNLRVRSVTGCSRSAMFTEGFSLSVDIAYILHGEDATNNGWNAGSSVVKEIEAGSHCVGRSLIA